MTAHGHFCWNELMSWDVEKAKTFYAETLGWTFEPVDMGPDGTYWIAMDGDQMTAGLFEMDRDRHEGMPETWCAYIAVDDVDARVEKARTAGATVMGEPVDVPMAGRIAMIREPGGALVGWMTPSEQEQAA